MSMNDLETNLQEAVVLLKASKKTTAFTGAGISVESGIPPFRGKGGIWNKYDPELFTISYFLDNPKESWELLKKIFFELSDIKPTYNAAHRVLAKMEERGLLDSIITQNIDNLHFEAGNRIVHEFHGNGKQLVCLNCGKIYRREEIDISVLPPKCDKCGGLLKPDFIFFGEGIPQKAYIASEKAAKTSDVFLVIGTTGEVMPACQIPIMAKYYRAKIIEVNTEPSSFTNTITDIYLKGKATEIMEKLEATMFN